MTGKLTIHGKEYPVTDKFQREVLDVHPDLADMAYGDLEHRKEELQRLSNARYSFRAPMPQTRDKRHITLTPEEAARLENIQHVMNVHVSINILQGRPHTDFGMEGVDQLHWRDGRPGCGCVHVYAYDHYKALAGDSDTVEHKHYPIKLCDEHKT